MLPDLVNKILAAHKLGHASIQHIKTSDNEHLFFVDDDYVLRITDGNIDNLVRKSGQVQALPSVPKILFAGRSFSGSKYNYVLCSKIRGCDYIETVCGMSDRQNADLGVSISEFLDSLHAITGSNYDIGHYIPVIPGHSGSWQEGHERYWEFIRNALSKLELNERYNTVFNDSFRYLDAHADALEYQHGPVLLHNDLHPKNIIVQNGAFSGVIDWECSQYGEPDFELCHFIHWCIYPPDPAVNLRPFLFSLFGKMSKIVSTNTFCTRQTIYQIEHELMQIIWSKGRAQDDRVPKIKNWLGGRIQELMHEYGSAV
jgi:hypothetical protein